MASVKEPKLSQTPLQEYLAATSPEQASPAMVGYIANLQEAAKVAPEIVRSIVRELSDQRTNLKLIASENYSSLSTQLSMGNLLTDKYAEGYPGHRFYAGCENVDDIESYACEQLKKLFKCDHAYVQPHSGADANMIAFWAILMDRVQSPLLEDLHVQDPQKLSHGQWNEVRQQLGNQILLGMDYYSGGHLTHGYRHNVSGRMFDSHFYRVSDDTGLLDYDAIERQATELKPLILLAGYSAYPRKIDFRRMRQIADKVGAVLMVDMAHFAGLVAGGVFENEFDPIPYSHVVTSTTHKSLRGPRGGFVLCTDEFSEAVDKGCPLVIGGPLPHVLAAKAIAFTEANRPEFKSYAHAIVKNAQALAQACVAEGLRVVTGGTDNHLLLVHVGDYGLTGRQAEGAVRECGITLNRNSLPNDANGPWYTSGLRLGTPAVTTLEMGEGEMKEIAAIMKLVLSNTRATTIASGPNAGKPSLAKYEIDGAARDEAGARVQALLARFPVYPELDLPFLERHFG